MLRVQTCAAAALRQHMFGKKVSALVREEWCTTHIGSPALILWMRFHPILFHSQPETVRYDTNCNKLRHFETTHLFMATFDRMRSECRRSREPGREVKRPVSVWG